MTKCEKIIIAREFACGDLYTMRGRTVADVTRMRLEELRSSNKNADKGGDYCVRLGENKIGRYKSRIRAQRQARANYLAGMRGGMCGVLLAPLMIPVPLIKPGRLEMRYERRM